MNEDRDIDIETFRRLRTNRMHAVADAISSLFQRGWLEAEAEVQECRPLKRNSTGPLDNYRVEPYLGGEFSFGNHYVRFTYEVSGKRYEGETFCADQLEKNARFTIRYNPRHPEQRNTIDSGVNWAAPVSKLITISIAIFILGCIALHVFSAR